MRSNFPGDKPTGRTRTFRVVVTIYAEVTLDESVIAQGRLPGDPIFGSGPEGGDEAQVLQHIVYNLVGNHFDLCDIDGYANCPNASAVVRNRDMEVEELEELERPQRTARHASKPAITSVQKMRGKS